MLRITILLIFLMTTFILYGQETDSLHMSFEDYDPPSTLVVPEHLGYQPRSEARAAHYAGEVAGQLHESES